MGDTLATIRSRVRSKLSEEGVRFFKDENVLKWINEGQDAISADCPWIVQTSLQRMTVPYVEIYGLPEDVIEIKATRLKTASGAPYRVQYVEPTVMDQLKQFQRVTAGSTSYRITYRAGLEGLAIEFYQPLSTRVKLVCDVLKRPKPLVNDYDISELPQAQTQTLVHYALWQAKVKDEETQQADRARRDFEEALTDLRSRRLTIQVDQMNKTRVRQSVGGWWP